MSLITYTCDTCKREVSKPQNPKGLEVISRCVITLGCRGKLYQTAVLQDYIRGSLPADVVGLTNYQPRRVLHNHTQTMSSVTWDIEHNLGTLPVVSVFVNAATTEDPNAVIEITPMDIVSVDNDNITLTFESAETGIAQLVARSTDPLLFQTSVTADETSTITQQVTSGGELTIATKLTSEDVSTQDAMQLYLNFITTEGLTIPLNYAITSNASSNSAWTGSDRVLIKGQIYNVRSFDLVSAAESSGLIPDGSTIQVVGYNVNSSLPGISSLAADQMFILLADDPYADPDRIMDAVVDLHDLTDTNAVNVLTLSGSELLVTTATIESIHPTIRVV